MSSTRALSALDLAFFVLETRERMSNVGPLAILKLPPRTRNSRAFADRLMRAMLAEPAAAPFDMVYRAPGLQGLPRLETAADVEVRAHCHRHTLEGDGANEALFAFVCRLHEKRLDRSRPHWELHVIDGLAGGRIALYLKVHHGVLDGRGLVEMFRGWFTDDMADRQVRAPWNVLPQRARRGAKPLDAAALVSRVNAAGRSLLALYGALARQAAASAGVAKGLPLPFLGTPSALRAKPSVRRSFAYCVLPLARLKAFGKAHGATVNDVLLTVLDMALNRYLRAHGKRHGSGPLVADMPVALGDGSDGGNQIAILQFKLGAPDVSPLERLAEVLQRTEELKAHVRRSDPSALVTYTAAVHGIPALLETLRVPKAPMLATAVISNPFGLPEKRYLGGAELEMALPVSVLAPGQSLNITAATYADGLQIAFLGLESELPHIQQLADQSVAAFEELALSATAPATGRKRTPSRTKPSTEPASEASKPRRAAAKAVAYIHETSPSNSP